MQKQAQKQAISKGLCTVLRTYMQTSRNLLNITAGGVACLREKGGEMWQVGAVRGNPAPAVGPGLLDKLALLRFFALILSFCLLKGNFRGYSGIFKLLSF